MPRTRHLQPASERGVALVLVILALAMMMLLIFGLLGSGLMETRISGNYRSQTQAFYIAESGVGQARSWLKANLAYDDLLDAALAEAVGTDPNSPPDQSTVTVNATNVTTPLGTQSFGEGSYTVWIRDNTDDADPASDSDGLYIITSRGSGPDSASKMVEVIVDAPKLRPNAAMNMHGQDSHPDFDQGTGGTGNRIPPGEMSGAAHDLSGVGGATGCADVPLFATDHADATNELIADLDDLRSDIVTRANSFCAADGSPSTMPGGPGGPCGGSNCCTPALWWVRGSDGTPRFDDADASSYGLLDLSAAEMHATDADYVTVTQPPTVVLPTPNTHPMGGAAGNTSDPAVEQVPPAEMQSDLDAIQNAIDEYDASDTITISSGTFNDGATHTYGSVSDPKLVNLTAEFRIESNTTFTGFGILVVEDLMRLAADSFFNWTGIVLIRGASPEFESRGGGHINGALYFDASSGTVRMDADKTTDDLKITYSCEAIQLAMSAVPITTVSWVELHQ